MLRDKVTEFFVILDDFHKEFASQLENRQLVLEWSLLYLLRILRLLSPGGKGRIGQSQPFL